MAADCPAATLAPHRWQGEASPVSRAGQPGPARSPPGRDVNRQRSVACAGRPGCRAGNAAGATPHTAAGLRRSGLGPACRDAHQGDRVLPAAVPSDPRERSVVGTGLHRVDQRVARASRSSPATTSRTCPASSASTTCASPEVQRRQIELATAVRPARVLLSPLLVRRHAAAAPAARPAAGEPRPGLPVLPLLGERELDPPLGRSGRATC